MVCRWTGRVGAAGTLRGRSKTPLTRQGAMAVLVQGWGWREELRVWAPLVTGPPTALYCGL